MLDENYKKALDTEEEKLQAIRADCAPFATPDKGGSCALIHKYVLGEIDYIIDLGKAFREADFSTPRKARMVYYDAIDAGKIGGDLSRYMRQHSAMVGPFRQAAIKKHAEAIATITHDKMKAIRDLVVALQKPDKTEPEDPPRRLTLIQGGKPEPKL